MEKETESNVKEYQAALNILKPNNHDVIHHEDGWWSRQNDAITYIQELVYIYPEYLEFKSKATPKKPNKTECPNCKNNNTISEEWGYEHNFCPDCGQALDWNKDEKREN